ncbi:hypothetical protein GOP47_0011117 [Adiantum capillus-veneris]|uniref:Uncharacterized protein n=1 Tax=Adiantum capillus-veneris TaxID=13818 RepID=A0A9D4ZF40_ADICA|nr:hypothetical protein GOP47_0011117 [Adiantum capillus-veneris]
MGFKPSGDSKVGLQLHEEQQGVRAGDPASDGIVDDVDDVEELHRRVEAFIRRVRMGFDAER